MTQAVGQNVTLKFNCFVRLPTNNSLEVKFVTYKMEDKERKGETNVSLPTNSGEMV